MLSSVARAPGRRSPAPRAFRPSMPAGWPGSGSASGRRGIIAPLAAIRRRSRSMVQIAFLTFFLSLTSGAHPVEVSVAGPVAAVELLLDGAPVGRLDGPP